MLKDCHPNRSIHQNSPRYASANSEVPRECYRWTEKRDAPGKRGCPSHVLLVANEVFRAGLAAALASGLTRSRGRWRARSSRRERPAEFHCRSRGSWTVI
jgi:hypothetical protein